MKKIILTIISAISLLFPVAAQANGTYRVTRDFIEPLEGDIRGYFVEPHFENIDLDPVTLVFNQGFGSLTIPSGEGKSKTFTNSTNDKLVIGFYLQNDSTVKSDITLFAPLKVTSINNTSASLSWGTAEGSPESPVTSYDVYRNSKRVVGTNATNYTDSNLSASTNYTYFIQALGSAGPLYVSNSVTTKTLDNTLPIIEPPYHPNIPTETISGSTDNNTSNTVGSSNPKTTQSTKQTNSKSLSANVQDNSDSVTPTQTAITNFTGDTTNNILPNEPLTLAARVINAAPYLIGVILAIAGFLAWLVRKGYIKIAKKKPHH